ncbi:hypothetical protein [Cronobacter sakazakii]|uniref:hypothetical protein n=1 Tax=Cronobacter sakazakii TaxID=28141 RepID=UPI003B632371
MALVRDALAQLRATARDTRCLDYVLESRHWNCKGNFFCYLHDHNENTIADRRSSTLTSTIRCRSTHDA